MEISLRAIMADVGATPASPVFSEAGRIGRGRPCPYTGITLRKGKLSMIVDNTGSSCHPRRGERLDILSMYRNVPKCPIAEKAALVRICARAST